MYLRAVHAEHHIPTLRCFIRENPLGILTTAIESPDFPLLQSSHIPWILDVEDESSETEMGVLKGHMARANPQAKAIIESVASGEVLEKEVLILFNAPAHHYVTPKFYVETKPATGKVVPTWDYAAVEVYGRARIYHSSSSPDTAAFLSSQITALSEFAETSIMGYDRPWSVGDAPAGYIEVLKKAIIGIEVRIERMGGRWKMSQEMGLKDRQGVIEGFETLDGAVGKKLAEMIRERGNKDMQ
ncbi:putative transcriptional regulator [Heliocybe sulcata]|uniref:Putative transcriptional regulator n=1 Tax=Heliocybe sulcata TaxID=5364 RepID=A0A5C3MKD1_9AGAM|nr:putative transcriptional regulator [Heliocybe sulcata]